LKPFSHKIFNGERLSDIEVYDFRFCFSSFFSNILTGWKECIKSLTDSGQLVPISMQMSLEELENRQKITTKMLWSFIESHPEENH
jgi:hypothetical protein